MPRPVVCHCYAQYFMPMLQYLTSYQFYAQTSCMSTCCMFGLLYAHMLHAKMATFYVLQLSTSHPGYFGKVGMRHFHLKRNKYFCPTVNLDKIWTLVSENTRHQFKDKTDKAPVIDVIRAVSPSPPHPPPRPYLRKICALPLHCSFSRFSGLLRLFVHD
jgi:hypothetical protein